MNRHRPRRGVTILEGVVSAAVLAFGLSGALQGILVATQQNAIARRMTTLAAIGRDVHAGLLTRSRESLRTTLLASSNCRALSALSASERAQLGSLDNATLRATPSACAVDLDAWEKANLSSPAARLTPAWNPNGAEASTYTRWLVYAPEATGAETLYVAVSIRNPVVSGRITHLRLIGLYDSTGNGAGVEL